MNQGGGGMGKAYGEVWRLLLMSYHSQPSWVPFKKAAAADHGPELPQLLCIGQFFGRCHGGPHTVGEGPHLSS